jgi:hypothetical protein
MHPAAAQHAHPADRFAREIVRFFTRSDMARSRRLMGNPLGGLAILAITFYHMRYYRRLQ